MGPITGMLSAAASGSQAAPTLAFGGRHIQDLIATAGEEDADGAPAWPELRAAVQGTQRGPRPPDARSLGLWARQYKGNIVDGLSLANESNSKGGSLWWLKDD